VLFPQEDQPSMVIMIFFFLSIVYGHKIAEKNLGKLQKAAANHKIKKAGLADHLPSRL
jgi:hypothetical protein